MGIYVYDARALARLPAEGPCQFPDLIQRLLSEGEIVAAFRSDAEWFDIGTVSEHQRAVEAFEQRSRGLRLMTETELERIRAEYEARDAAATSPYRWDNPGYVTYMQIVERALLKAFRDAGVRLEGARVLDVGAGSGYFLHRLTEYGAAEGHGVDLMKDRVAAGQRRYPTLQPRGWQRAPSFRTRTGSSTW